MERKRWAESEDILVVLYIYLKDQGDAIHSIRRCLAAKEMELIHDNI